MMRKSLLLISRPGLPISLAFEKMTVAKDTRKKNSNKNKNMMSATKKTEEKENNFSSFDDLIKIIDTLEAEDQVSKLFEDQDILSKSYKSLLGLMGRVDLTVDDNGNGNDNVYDNDDELVYDNGNDNGNEEKLMDIMTEFLRDGIINEEVFEDFFVEDNDDEEEVLSDDISEADYISETESISVNSEIEKSKKSVKFAKDTTESTKSNKSSRNMKELEMLMEKVDDESDLDDDEEYESEYESGSDKDEISFAEDEGIDKKDMFAEDKIEGARLSSFEKSQITLKSQIASLETENIETRKPWSLRGEINANQRPTDSLLEEAVEFENLSRPTPQITEERTEEIEEVIKRRIAEAAWDDVERKDGRDLTLLNGMSVANQKSARALLEDVANSGPKRSLTQVYEEETANNLKLSINSADSENEEIKLKRDELRGLFAKICRHIDGLSGNRFAPKVYVQSDFQIKTLGKK